MNANLNLIRTADVVVDTLHFVHRDVMILSGLAWKTTKFVWNLKK